MTKLRVRADQAGPRIPRHLYGHFAEHLGRCVYEGLWVGEDSAIPNLRGLRKDVLAALKKLAMPNLRWPGGCFADTYHWRDGIGPRAERPSMVNIHWGGTTENNHFGTHEFLDLCAELGCEPYICGNVGSGTVREMAEWLEYLTHPGPSPMAALRARNGRKEPWPLTYWAVGNENWGCGGDMTAAHYANEFRRYQTYCRHFGGGRLYKVACGWTKDWNEVLMREAARYMDGLSIHHYTVPGPWDHKGSAVDYSDEEWNLTLQKALAVDAFLAETEGLMDRHDPQGRVGLVLDEWGTWFDVEAGTNPGFLYQQNTMRDALVAALSFHVFHRHLPRLHMANIAQTANVLQAMVLTQGSKMVLTPTYHVFEMFKVHQEGLSLALNLEGISGGPVPRVSASASLDGKGGIHISLCNTDLATEEELVIEVQGRNAPTCRGRVLTGPSKGAVNDFDRPDIIAPRAMEALKASAGAVRVMLPPRSVSVLELS